MDGGNRKQGRIRSKGGIEETRGGGGGGVWIDIDPVKCSDNRRALTDYGTINRGERGEERVEARRSKSTREGRPACDVITHPSCDSRIEDVTREGPLRRPIVPSEGIVSGRTLATMMSTADAGDRRLSGTVRSFRRKGCQQLAGEVPPHHVFFIVAYLERPFEATAALVSCPCPLSPKSTSVACFLLRDKHSSPQSQVRGAF
ncbi:uncharacterized protein LY79DRAFT_329480 [Colletotrichum navitas]|uniref:Uncharacterized protein n=1 Tax=Colletotrichum navitas TaxID=681940 RepID=A0AAD8PTW5_9PEZI|nr:uncharacterized protein LY79DRAFT_329480 [Colletotrichum navitas]KAK1579943.1 hypothetical protein LY79DRAFT_329480 [Colletotrichum navitas]